MVLAHHTNGAWERTQTTHEVSVEFGTVSENATPAWQTITGTQAQELMNQLDNFMLLDVRTEAEFDGNHIPTAALIPYDELWGRAHELPSTDTPILIYCRTGRRSEIAAQILANMGFTRIYDFGGIYDWTGETTE